MLSVAQSSFADSCIGRDGPFLDLEFTSWDLHDLIFEPELEYEPKPITSILMSSQSNKIVFNSIETNQTSPGSIESYHSSVHLTRPGNEPGDLVDRKLKRMRSNRESARRSRMRKQQRVDKLTNQANRLSITNQELSNQLRFMLHNGLIVRSENQRLQTEHTLLRHRLIELQNLMIFHGIQQTHNHENNNIASNLFGTRAYGQNSVNESMYLIALNVNFNCNNELFTN